MRWWNGLLLALAPLAVLAQEKVSSELERIQTALTAARQAAAADPIIRDAYSPPMKAYLAEQQRRRLLRQAVLRKRLAEYQGDVSKTDLVPVLKQQLADLETRPPEEVNFDAAYGYFPTTGLIGYSRKVRFLDRTAEGQSLILVENVVLAVEGLGTSSYASGKFFSVDTAFLIGAPRPEYLFQEVNRKSFSATLVDLAPLLRATTAAKGVKPE